MQVTVRALAPVSPRQCPRLTSRWAYRGHEIISVRLAITVLASSSRTQVAVHTAGAAVSLTCERSSVNVRWRPLVSVPIVTWLVTHFTAREVAGEPGG
jgi:hypothetical protein